MHKIIVKFRLISSMNFNNHLLLNLEKIEDVRKLLVDHDVNGVNNQGDTPLIIAVKEGS